MRGKYTQIPVGPSPSSVSEHHTQWLLLGADGQGSVLLFHPPSPLCYFSLSSEDIPTQGKDGLGAHTFQHLFSSFKERWPQERTQGK